MFFWNFKENFPLKIFYISKNREELFTFNIRYGRSAWKSSSNQNHSLKNDTEPGQPHEKWNARKLLKEFIIAHLTSEAHLNESGQPNIHIDSGKSDGNTGGDEIIINTHTMESLVVFFADFWK